MNNFQKAQLALRAKSELVKLAKENMSLGGKGARIETPLGRVDDVLAKRAHTSKDTIFKAAKILQHIESNQASSNNYYKRLLKGLNEGRLTTDKVYKTFNRKWKQAEKKAQAAAAAKDRSLPYRVTVLNMNMAEVTNEQMPDGSVDMIITDPPYTKGSLPCFEALASFASRKLKGGSLLFYFGNYQLSRIMRIFSKYEDNGELTYAWLLPVIHTGLSPRFHVLGVWADWKPLLWFLKGERKERLVNWKDIHDVIYSKPRDKDMHPWAQSPVEAEYLIDKLTVSEDSLVVDPFLGSGAFGLAVIKVGRQFIGIEIDKETFENARDNLITKAANLITAQN